MSARAQLYRRQGPSSASAVTSASNPAAPGPSSAPGDLACGMACISLGDMSDCDIEQTQTCLCKSGRYIASVNTCLASKCSPADAKTGSDYSYGSCLFLGVNVSTVAIPTSTGIDLTSAPEVYSKAFVNVQAIMSSICAALCAIALILGFFACRARARIETQTQQGSWTNMGTQQGSRTGHAGGKSFGGVSRPGGTNSTFDPTATFASASYPPPIKRGEGMGMERARGFTNRLTLNEEEWEMEDAGRGNNRRSTGRGEGRSGSGSGSTSSFVSSGGKEEMDLSTKDGQISPVTFTSNRSVAGSEVELEGSTIHLATLSRGTGGLGRMI